MAIPSVSEMLAHVQASPSWGGASIGPVEGQFPLCQIEWHPENGFVIQCYEDETAWSDFLLVSPQCGPPAIEIELGGQALERWPAELFVDEGLAHRALTHFIETGRQDPSLNWIRIDAFPRETIWQDREGRETWESEHRATSRDV